MAISKIGSKALVDCSVAAVDIADNSITAAKLAGSIANAKLANSSVTINSTSISLGGSANINALDWQSVIVADGSTGTTGVAGRGYFINTTSAAHTFTLPVSATRGDTIAIKDYAGTFATFNLTIARNGHNIQGVANNSLISTNRASVVLVYVDVTRGWEFTTESNVAFLGPLFITATGGTITTSGNYKIHSFTGDGSFVVSSVGNPAGSIAVDYLVVAGGGGAGGAAATSVQSGGGGAGGYRESVPSPAAWSTSPLASTTSLSVSATSYPITVGGGGAGGPVCATPGTQGSSSIFSTITSSGGGYGAVYNPSTGGNGGSGGGGGPSTAGPGGTGGTGNTPPASPPQGNAGGNGYFAPAPSNGRTGGGGGGATSVGGNGNDSGAGGSGGSGATSSINGSPTARAGGGGGAGCASGGSATAGGGAGATGQSVQGSDGTANTGGGGGGSGVYNGPAKAGGAGGKGIVVIRYKFQ